MNEPVFHPLAGRSNCVGCHGTGQSGAPGMPQTHDGMVSSTCLTCHPPAAPSSQALYGLSLPFALLFALGALRLARLWRPSGRAQRAAEVA